MAAVITDKLKTQILLDLQRDFNDSDNNYFAGIGKSEDWNDSDIAVTPRNSIRDERNARLGLQSIKNITDLSFVIPRYNWISGAVYSGYDDNYVGYPTNAFYVMNDNQQIYMCLQQGRTNANPPQTVASTVQPTGNTTGTPFRTADGYMWKFMYSIGALKGSKFISSAYIPVTRVQDSATATLGPGELAVDSNSPAEDVEQQLIQNNAVGGQILGYVMTNTGSGYTSVPTVTIKGDGTEAKGVATVAGGAVVNIRVKDSTDGTIAFGSGYKYASVEISGGGGDSASARAVIGPRFGLGYDSRKDLKSSAIMFNTKPAGAEDNDFLIDQDFRQVMLFRNMRYADSEGFYTRETGKALTKLDISSIADGPFVNDVIIEGATSGAKAYIDDVDSNGDLFIHQSEYTGFRSFQTSETISIVEGGGSTTATISNIITGVVDPLSGELLYIDNRAAVRRSTDQTEDLKIVIQL
jgi:hypothetical protein